MVNAVTENVTSKFQEKSEYGWFATNMDNPEPGQGLFGKVEIKYEYYLNTKNRTVVAYSKSIALEQHFSRVRRSLPPTF